MNTYSEFRLRIDRGPSTGTYRVVATAPSGEALGRFKLPFSDLELENFVLTVGRTRKGKRRIESPEMERAKDFGSRLFKSLFEGDVKELYSSSFRDAQEASQVLRITLSLTGAPELSRIPWEYLYVRPSFLSISTWTPIVRYLDIPKPRRPLRITLPLRILGVVSAPSDTEPIDVAAEKAKLGQALAPLVESGWLAIDWLEKATLRDLQRQLRRADYHIFHYIGHGGYDHDADDGVLLFEDEYGRPTRITGVQLGNILHDEISLRLAVLNACEGARSSVEDPFSGVATSLIEFEIPAVIGMQFEITDRSAIVFASEFYSALADGYPVDSALAEARKAIYADRNDVEWATPVLFMRVQDGLLFEVPEHASARDQKLDPSVVVVAAKVEAEAVKAGADPATAAALGKAAATATTVEKPDPVVTDPVVTDPVVTDPVVTDPVVTDPVVTDPVVTDPVVTDPVVTDPVVTDPVVTDPVVTDPVVTDPVVTDPVVTDPVVTDPVVTDPVVTDPVVTHPVVTDPVVTDPVVTHPVVTDPVVTDPVVNGTLGNWMATRQEPNQVAAIGRGFLGGLILVAAYGGLYLLRRNDLPGVTSSFDAATWLSVAIGTVLLTSIGGLLVEQGVPFLRAPENDASRWLVVLILGLTLGPLSFLIAYSVLGMAASASPDMSRIVAVSVLAFLIAEVLVGRGLARVRSGSN